MRILYGVTGEGMGHAIRSEVVLNHLIAQGHSVEIVASGRAAEFLRERFGETNTIHGFHMVLEENRIRRGKTLWSNIRKGISELPKNIAQYYAVLEKFAPELVISDFESWTYLFGQRHKLPIFSIDNMQIINRCTHPESIIALDKANFQLTKAFVKSKLPYCDHYFVTTFFYPEVRKKNTTLVPPILRPRIRSLVPGEGEHLLVYQSVGSNDELLRALHDTGIECRIYGMKRDLSHEECDGKLRFLPFSDSGFLDDLATAKAVVAGAGFTLMGEALSLRKPMLALPIKGQFEQLMNAGYLRQEGFGDFATGLTDSQSLPSFLARLPKFNAALQSLGKSGNSVLFGELDRKIAALQGA